VPQVNERRAGPDGAAVPRRARRLAWALLGVTVALLAVGPVIGLTGGESWSAEFGFIPVALAFAVVGALVAARTRNRLGWLFLAAAAISAVTVAANAYAARPATAGLPGAAWVGWAFTVLLGITGSLFFLTLLLFPDGRPPSRRWWFVVWVAAVAGVAEMVTSAVSDVNFSSNFPKLTDPVTLVAPLNEAYNLETTVQVFILLAYAIVTALLACVYAGPVLLSTQVLGLRTPVAVAIATLAAAALFNPLRRRVQRLVDRRFNRARYDAEVTVAAFAARLKDSVDLDAVRDDLAGVVTRALEPAHVSVWISRPG
jgi:hypothetical protein